MLNCDSLPDMQEFLQGETNIFSFLFIFLEGGGEGAKIPKQFKRALKTLKMHFL
jgi:hypothetical protein